MLRKKLLLRRLAYVPWLLAVGLVMGWNGEAVAGGDDAHYYGANHLHATDPKMVLTAKLDEEDHSNNEIIVSWSMSRTRGFDDADNGQPATGYAVSLFSGRIPVDPADIVAGVSNSPIQSSPSDITAAPFTYTLTSDDIDYRGQDDATDTGEYWVRIEVKTEGNEDGSSIDPSTYFAKQIVLKPDYVLSVHPTSVREDIDDPVTITVRVRVGSDDQVDDKNDTNVLLDLAQYAKRFSDRFSIDYSRTLRILKGEKEAVGTITFTPTDNEDDEEGDLPITMEGFVSGKSVSSADITLIDDDKVSRYINLAFSPDDLSKSGPATDIEVTASLDGEVLDDDLRFTLNIDDAYETNDDAAKRETDYKANMGSITIRDGKVSGRTTINIRPLNKGDGLIGVIVKHPPEIDGRMIKVNRAFIHLTALPAKDIIGLKATPFAIREDAGVKEVTLEVSLRNPVSKDERVRFNFETGVDDVENLSEAFDDRVENATRDTHWDATVETLFISQGETKGTTTMVVEVENDSERNDNRTFTVIATVGDDSHRAGILITDDDSTSEQISLEVSPDTISEDAGETEITVTGTLDGKEFDDEVVVFLSIAATAPDDDEMAARDQDYDDDMNPLRIPAGSITGTTTITITPVTNDGKENDEKIRLISLESHPPEALDEDGDVQTLTVNSVDITLKDSGEEDSSQPEPQDPTIPAFTADDAIADQVYTVGTAIDPLVLPEATGGDAPLTYGTLGLPAGLEFDAATRTLSGTPTAATDGAVNVFYTVSDVDKQAALLIFSITVDEAEEEPEESVPLDPAIPSFTADDAIADQVYTAGTAIDPLVLPEATGGDAPLTYAALGLPAGLEFDAATRTLSGTPTAATDGAVNIFYTVSDVDKQATLLIFSITVNAAEVPPPVADGQLTATPSSIREDAGETQVLLTVSLMAAKDTDERITFRIVAPSEGTDGKPAVRDADYDAKLRAVVTIPAGTTVGETTLTLIPMNNSTVDGLRAFGVEARFASGATLLTDIEIADDETPSTSIALSVSPNMINEEIAETTITVTATLDGKALAEDAIVIVSIDASSTASRDVDYSAEFNPLIRIPAGSIKGSTQLTIQPINDTVAEGSETIKLTSLMAGLTGGEVEITLADQAAMVEEPEEPGDASLAFAADAAVADQTYTAGTAIDALVLPAASGGTGTRTYSVLSVLPAGLEFDAATRTLSGTPTAATDGAVVVIYTVEDEASAVDLLTFSITVNPALSSSSFGFAAAEVADQTYTAGTAIDSLVLPEATGGTGALTYRVLGLPAGLVFDAATRTLSGTPSAATDGAGEVFYTVEDEASAVALLTFSITVNVGLSTSFGFAAAEVADQTYTAGTAIDSLVLPAASGGTGALTYSILSTLPAGLEFDAATRTLSGTPSAATDGAVEVTYLVTDEGGAAAVLTFSITVNVGLSSSLAFADNAAIDNQEYTAGTPIDALVLPEASGGTGALTYRLVGLPAGLEFDAATRTLSGKPSAATDDAVEVTYIVTDEGGAATFLTFSITVNPGLSFGDLFGSGKVVPTASHDLAAIREFVVGQRVEGLTLPEGTGGTAPLTYRLSPALPAGLTFDATTRTIAGTPRAEGEFVYTYTVTDANGASASLSLQTLPAAFSLANNFPNPFNPATTIKYALPQAADVELAVYNVVGQVVRTLVAEHQSAGRYVVEWDATDDSGRSLSSGMYFYRLQAGEEFHEVKKMLLLK